jgi:hypothetical protein
MLSLADDLSHICSKLESTRLSSNPCRRLYARLFSSESLGNVLRLRIFLNDFALIYRAVLD